MKLIKNKDPFPHILVEDYYTEKELFHIWKELEFLSYQQKLDLPQDSGSAIENNEFLKNNSAIFIDSLYKHRNISSILTINRKLFDIDFINEVSSFDLVLKTFEICNFDTTMVSYYENSQYYKPHVDFSFYTSLTWLYKEPKMFKGGDLHFPEYDYTCEVKNNRMIFIPSCIRHQVFEVSMDSYDPDEFGMYSTNGRYCISQFASMRL